MSSGGVFVNSKSGGLQPRVRGCPEASEERARLGMVNRVGEVPADDLNRGIAVVGRRDLRACGQSKRADSKYHP